MNKCITSTRTLTYSGYHFTIIDQCSFRNPAIDTYNAVIESDCGVKATGIISVKNSIYNLIDVQFDAPIGLNAMLRFCKELRVIADAAFPQAIGYYRQMVGCTNDNPGAIPGAGYSEQNSPMR